MIKPPISGDVKYTLVITNYSPSTFLSFSSDSILLPLYEITLKDEGATQTRVYIKVISRRYSYLYNVSDKILLLSKILKRPFSMNLTVQVQ
jgi:hypothetical protein